MSTNKKYYYLKLKENFYDSEQMIILQNMQDGYLYSDILMKLYLRSLKSDGKLMFSSLIPYTPQVLAQIVRHQVGTVEKALTIFKQLGLIEVLDNGAIYMLDIQNFIGKSSTEGDRKRQYRSKIIEEKKAIGQMSDKRPPEIEKEIELDIEKEIDINTKKETTTNIYTFVEENFGRLLTSTEVEKIQKWLSLFDEEVIKYAFEKSVLAGVRTFRYVEGTLNNWQGCNYKTIQDVKDSESKRTRGNQLNEVSKGRYKL